MAAELTTTKLNAESHLLLVLTQRSQHVKANDNLRTGSTTPPPPT